MVAIFLKRAQNNKYDSALLQSVTNKPAGAFSL